MSLDRREKGHGFTRRARGRQPLHLLDPLGQRGEREVVLESVGQHVDA